jgi:hypothetical protein
MEGTLEKKGARRVQGWKRFFFSLDRMTGLLKWYESADHEAEVGQQHIASVLDVADRPRKRQNRFDFVVTGGAAISCTAPSPAEKILWLVAVNSITSTVAAPPSSPGRPDEEGTSAAPTYPAVVVVNTPRHMADV